MSAHSSPAAARRRADIWFALGAVVALAALAWVVITMQQLGNDLRTANDARDALAAQVQKLGEKPVAGPPGSRGEPGESIVGPSGPSGPPGAPGKPGASGKPAPTMTPSPGASGASGEPGKPGADSTVAGPPGASGAPGSDSTVPGPSGPPGPAGQDGTNGSDGADGKPPASWTFTWLGTTYTCQPADDFDESNPQYECEPDRPSNGNSDSGTQAAALDPNRRQYA